MRRQSDTARRRVRQATAFGALVCFFAAFTAPASADQISFSAVETLTSTVAAAPTVASDQSDYAPGSLVTLAGAGWQPGEAVEISVNDEAGSSWMRRAEVTADADGRFSDSFTLPDWFVATYSVAATGSSGSATTRFTDASLSGRAAPAGVTFSLTTQGFTTSTCATPVNGSNGIPTTASVTAGTSVPISFGSAPFVKLTAGAASAPAGATFASWAGPSSFNSTSASICVATPTGGTDHVYTATYTGGTTPPTPQNQTITFAAPTGKTYGDADFAAGAAASSGLPVSYAVSTPGTCSIVGAAIHLAAAGTCSVTASQEGNGSFNPAPPVTQSFAIAPKAVTGSYTTQSRIYDGTTAVSITGRTLSGVVGADAVSLVGGTAAFGDKTVGSGKPVSGTGFSLDGVAAGNYLLAATSISSTGTITPATLTATFTAMDKVYDGTTAAAISGRFLAGVLLGDNVTIGAGSAAFADASAGVDKTVIGTDFTLGGTDAGNYELSSAPLTTLASITGLGLAGSFTAADKVYDGGTGAEVLARSLVGVLDGDEVELSGGTAAFADAAAGVDKPVTLAGASLGGADAGNYALTGVAMAQASIERLGISGAFTAADKVYDGGTAAAVLSRSLVGVLDGDEVELSGGTAAFADAAAGADKPVTLAGASLGGADAGNYALTGVAMAQASIERLGISGAFTAADKVYDGGAAAAVLARSLVGVLDGDEVELTGGTAAFEDASAAIDKSVTLSDAALAGVDAGNYSLTGVSAARASISKKPLAVTGPSPAAIVYGDDLPALAPAYDGFVTGESAGVLTVAPTCTLAPSYRGAGSYGVRCSGGEDENYTFAYEDGSLTVATKPLTGSFSAADKVYDGTTDAEATPHALQGLVGSDNVQLEVANARFENEDAGEDKSVSAELSLTGDDAVNYHLTSATANLFAAITRKPLTIGGAEAVSRDYDGTTAATVDFGGATLISPVVGDDVSIDSSGYSASFATASAEAAKPVTVLGVALAGGDASNYSVAQPSGLSAEIRRLAITGSFTTPASKVYDGLTAAAVLSRSVNGAVAGDAVVLTGGTAAFDTKDVGSGKTVTLTGASLAGSDAGNYTLSSVATASADIVKALLTVTAHNKAMILNGAVPALTWSIAGFVDGESIGASSGVTGAPACSTATGAAPGAFDITCTVGTLAAANYTFAFIKGKLTVSYALTACLGSAGHAILQPIDVDGSSVFKQGSTVPAKFRVCDARGASIGTTGVVASFRLASTSVGVDGPIDEAVVSTTPDTAFRWSATDQQWIFNVNTKSLVANRTYNYEISLNDGSKILFRFGLR